MAENESMQGKSLSQELSVQARIEEAIKNAIRENKEKIVLADGISLIVLEVKMGNERDTYDVLLEGKNIVTAKKDSTGKISYQNYKLNIDDAFKGRLNIENLRVVQAKERAQREVIRQVEKEREPKEVVPKDKQSDALRIEMENKIKTGRAVKMEMDRETSSTENMRMFMKRAWRVSAQEVYRVQGKDAHSFKYVAKTGNPEKPYEEINLSHRREGTNSMQQITVMENGQFKKRTVSSLLLKGNYGIATAIPTNVATGNKTTYLVARTPSGRYIGIAAGQKQGVNRNTSSDRIQKDFMSRENSVYDLEDVIAAAELGSKIYGLNNDGKLTAEEIELVRKLKDEKGMKDDEVIKTIKTVELLRKMGYDMNQIREMLENTKETPKNKSEVEKLAEDRDDEEYVGYGQKRPH